MKKQDFIPIVLLIIVVLRALVDALFYKGLQFESKIIENSIYATILFLPFLYYKKDLSYLFSVLIVYICLHFAFFDPLCNLFYGFELGHVGTTSGIYDVIMAKLSWWSYVLRAVVLSVGVIIHLNSLR